MNYASLQGLVLREKLQKLKNSNKIQLKICFPVIRFHKAGTGATSAKNIPPVTAVEKIVFIGTKQKAHI